MVEIDPGQELPLQFSDTGRSSQRAALVPSAQTRIDRRAGRAAGWPDSSSCGVRSIEVPEIAAAREIFLVVQSLKVNRSKTHPEHTNASTSRTRRPSRAAIPSAREFTMLTVNGEATYWVRNTTQTAPAEFTPLGVPEYHVQTGRSHPPAPAQRHERNPALPGVAGLRSVADRVRRHQHARSMALDMSGEGVTKITPENLFTAPIQLAAQANRIELLLRAPKKEGTYALSSLASDRIFPAAGQKFDIARFVVGGSPVKMGIPAKLPKPTREYPLIEDKDIVAQRTFVFGQGPRKDLLTGFGFFINGELYQEMDCPTRPKVGTCEQWRIVNKTDDLHPFHLHENSFQLIAINDASKIPSTFGTPSPFRRARAAPTAV